jgi:hypothetical protein
MTMSARKYDIEITDTFGGEANYSWVRRETVTAKNMLGAVNKIARSYGSGWRKDWDASDTSRYNLKGACICMFVTEAENM